MDNNLSRSDNKGVNQVQALASGDPPPREEGLGEVMKRGPRSGSKFTTSIRQELRHNPTYAEKLFWTKVSRKQFCNLKFRRQHGIGKYITDFYCAELRLVVEIDGDSHFTEAGLAKDRIRDEYIKSLGYKILRYNNDEVINNIDAIFGDLNKLILNPSQPPLTRGGETNR